MSVVRLILVVSLIVVLIVLAVVAYSLNLLTPGFTVYTYVNGRPVNAYVQVFALLPPGMNESLVEVWNGTATNGFIRVPITVLSKVARGWVGEGLGGEGVGLEVVATYVNGSTVYFTMQFITYRPGDVVNALTNPLIAMAKMNMGTVRLNLTMAAEVPNHQSSANAPSIPEPPAPIGCWWNVLQQLQSPSMQIPIAWAINNYPTMLLIFSAYSQQQTTATVNYLAAAAILKSVSINYRLIGSSVSTSASIYNSTAAGLGYSNTAYLYQVGTLGFAELQMVCWTGPTNTYAYEAYVQSISNNGAIYYSHNATYINDLLNKYEEVTGTSLMYVPFDEVYAMGGNGGYWSYYFSNVQQYSSPFGLVATIPVGLLISLIAPEYSIPLLAVNLAAGLQISSTTMNLIYVATPGASSYPAYGDLLVTAIPVVYSNPNTNYFYYPYMLGFVLDGLGSYSSGTSMYIDGPGVIFNQCFPLYNSYNWTVYVYIGNTPLLVPGGSVAAIVYNSNGVVIWSGTFSMQSPHQPITVSIPWTIFNYGVPYNTYEIQFTYSGYVTPEGSITYGANTTTITVYAEFQSCAP